MSHHVMQALIAFVTAHQVVLATGFWWTFAAFMSSVPPLPADAGWWAKTFYGFFQKIAANREKQPAAVPGGPTVEVPSVQPPAPPLRTTPVSTPVPETHAGSL